MTHPRKPARAVRSAMAAAVPVALAVTLVACSGGEEATRATVAESVGPGEGDLELVVWSGYAEDGSNDPRVDWVSPFEERTKCKVNVRSASTTQEMVDLMSSPDRSYDGVSAPPEVAAQLIADDQTTPVNPALIDGFKDLQPKLRAQFEDGSTYHGVPFVWGANVLMYNPEVADQAPRSWGALFDAEKSKEYSGRLVLRDSPLTLGDAALYLKSRDRSLGITDPFELNEKQLAAAADVLSEQRSSVATYWDHPSDAIDAFASGQAAMGQVWPYHVDVLDRADRPVEGMMPREGTSGWVDSWMISARTKNQNCMYQWLNWVTSETVQEQVAQWAGVAPANPESCEGLGQRFCSAYHVRDRNFLDKVNFAHPTSRECDDDGSGCVDYDQWASAWRDVTGR